jgi:uncharacterized protein (DUF1499 family)
MIKKFIFLALLFAVFGTPTLFYIKGVQSAKMIPEIGVNNNTLVPCPDKPNCSSSFASSEDEVHYLAPVSIDNNPIQRLLQIAEDSEMSIIEVNENYLRLTESSKMFGFVDDIEFLYLEDKQVLHFRSASRVGHSDMKKNRERLQTMVNLLN